jgi:hypothetical protein
VTSSGTPAGLKAFARVRAALADVAQQYEYIGRLQARGGDSTAAERDLAVLKAELQAANERLGASHRDPPALQAGGRDPPEAAAASVSRCSK